MQRLHSDITNEISRRLDDSERWIFHQTCRKFRRLTTRPSIYDIRESITSPELVSWLKTHGFFDVYPDITRRRVFEIAMNHTRINVIRRLFLENIIPDKLIISAVAICTLRREIVLWFYKIDVDFNSSCRNRLSSDFAFYGDLAFTQWTSSEWRADWHDKVFRTGHKSILQWIGRL